MEQKIQLKTEDGERFELPWRVKMNEQMKNMNGRCSDSLKRITLQTNLLINGQDREKYLNLKLLCLMQPCIKQYFN